MSGVLALIPARSGSKGVVDKNIRKLGGKPLLEWSIAVCLASKLIDRVIVSTDSEDYAKMAIAMGAEAPFLRPNDISRDDSTDYEFVVHALDSLLESGEEPSVIAHIRPTTPFRDPVIIDRAIQVFSEAANVTALRSVHSMSESAYKSFEINESGMLKQIGASDSDLDWANNARQGFPETFIANGYVDVLSTRFIRDYKRLHGSHVMPFITPPTNEVDTEYDFSFLEIELQMNPALSQRLFA